MPVELDVDFFDDYHQTKHANFLDDYISRDDWRIIDTHPKQWFRINNDDGSPARFTQHEKSGAYAIGWRSKRYRIKTQKNHDSDYWYIWIMFSPR